MRPSTARTFSFITGLWLGLNPVVAAGPSWRQFKELAETHDAQMQFKTAADEFERAIAALPTQLESTKVELEAEAAADYLRLHQTDRAKQHVDKALAVVASMRARQQALAPDALMALGTTVGEAKAYPFADALARLRLAVEILEQALPDRKDRVDIECSYAKALIDDNQLISARKELEHILKSQKMSARDRSGTELYLAATEDRLHQPQALLEISAKLSKTCSAPKRLMRIADGLLWADNLDKAAVTLDSALSMLPKTCGASAQMEQSICHLYFCIYYQKLNFKEQEKWARRRVAILEKYGPQSEAYSRALQDLIISLQNQKRFKEAAAIKMPPSLGYYLFVTDADKKALRQAEQARQTP